MRREILLAGVIAGMLGLMGSAMAQSSDSVMPMGSMSMSHGTMAGHMMLSETRPLKPGDQAKADAIAAAAKAAIEPYRDYKKALADGFEIFLPEPAAEDVSLYELRTRVCGGVQVRSVEGPTSLLYERRRMVATS